VREFSGQAAGCRSRRLFAQWVRGTPPAAQAVCPRDPSQLTIRARTATVRGTETDISVTDQNPPSLAIIGAGPRGTGLLERLAANLPELGPDLPLRIHVIDPFPAGAGKVWRYEQSPVVKMNSMAEDVTMFTDQTVSCDGPIVPGPTLQEWAGGDGDLQQPDLLRQRQSVGAFTFPTRQLQSEYLSWVFRRTAAHLPAHVELTVHDAAAIDLTDGFDGRQYVWLAGRAEPLVVDLVIMALGHLDAAPAEEHTQLEEFALYHGLFYQPPAFFDDADVAGIAPGENVVFRGFGLAFIDLMAMLTEGRGGRYRTRPDGSLEYVPSGNEPVMYVGSRRGVPYQSKIEYRLPTPLARLPRFLTTEALQKLGTTDVQLDRDVIPLVHKELGWAYYHQLFAAHPDRVSIGWSEFAAEYAKLNWGSRALARLVRRGVPDANDRLDLERLDRPLQGRHFASFEDLQAHLRAYISGNRARHANPEFSPDLAVFEALLTALVQIGSILGRLSVHSRVVEFPVWFKFFNYYSSGPPGHRLDQLVALSEAGVVKFLGADMWVRADPGSGVFRAGSDSCPGSVEATALVDAQLPAASVSRTREPLIAQLFARGECTEETLVDEAGTGHNTGLLRVDRATGQVLGRNRPHARRFAFGIFTNGGSAGGFTRPGRNGLFFRQNDAAARRFLTMLGRVAGADKALADSVSEAL